MVVDRLVPGLELLPDLVTGSVCGADLKAGLARVFQ